MGLRLRLKSTFDASSFSGPGKIVAKAMQTYGLIVADIGTDWYFRATAMTPGTTWRTPAIPTSGELITDFIR